MRSRVAPPSENFGGPSIPISPVRSTEKHIKIGRKSNFLRHRLIYLLPLLLICCICIYTMDGGVIILRWCIAFGNNRVQGGFSRSARYVMGISADSQHRADAYYEEQQPIIAEAAKKYKLHWYFAEIAPKITSMDVEWYEIIGKRTRTMASLLQNQGRDDFKVEKDKCEMNRFFKRNKMPMVPVTNVWRQPHSFMSDLQAISKSAKRWPLFIKFCHLTQGSAHGTRLIPSADWLEKNWGEIRKWVFEKWVYRPDDWERPWREDGNFLTDSLTRGVFIQPPTELTLNPNTGKHQVIEFKVEVLWGRAILGVSKDLTGWRTALATRSSGSDGSAAIEVYPTGWDELLFRGQLLPAGDWWHWILDEGHLDCVWDLAERAALVMGIDEVRIDIFISRDAPHGCLINEDSLTSGMWYGPHFRNLAKLWAEPHLRQWYDVYSNSISVYNQTTADIPSRVLVV